MKFSKTPKENFDYAMSFAKQLQADETVDAVVSVTATPRYTGRDTTSKIIDTAEGREPEGSGKAAIFWLKGGKAGERHVIKVTVTTSGGRTLEGLLDLSIVRRAW